MLIDVNHTTLYYEIYGACNTKTIILLHGNGGCISYFASQIEFFSLEYRVIAIDSRGHGKSSWNGEKLSISLLSDDIIAFCNELNIDKATFIGFSDGANILMDMMIKAPSLISNAVLNGGNLKYKGLKFIVRISIKCTYIVIKCANIINNKCANKEAVWRIMLDNLQYDYSNYLNNLIPTLVIAGDNDMIKQSESERIHQSIRGSVLKIIKGDHFIACKKSDEFNRILKEFIQ